MHARVKLVVLGTSMCGLHALERLLRGLTPDFPLPLAIVQHRASDTRPRTLRRFDDFFCGLIQNPVIERPEANTHLILS